MMNQRLTYMTKIDKSVDISILSESNDCLDYVEAMLKQQKKDLNDIDFEEPMFSQRKKTVFDD